MRKLTKKEEAFQRQVWEYYRAHGRELPWRNTTDPYHILVSEVMLQQTQVERVKTKYHAFLHAFPSVEALSKAPLSKVLRKWQGLGYNRRAKMLHQCAKEVVRTYGSTAPETQVEFEKLPGIGPYTAAAIVVFAYGKPIVMIETNIRTVYLHHFCAKREYVSDAELRPLIERTCDEEDPRHWYYALMDYGAYLKRTTGNQNTRSKHYTKQSKFDGSDRQIRGGIIRMLSEASCHEDTLQERLQVETDRLNTQLSALAAEGFITKKREKWHLAS